MSHVTIHQISTYGLERPNRNGLGEVKHAPLYGKERQYVSSQAQKQDTRSRLIRKGKGVMQRTGNVSLMVHTFDTLMGEGVTDQEIAAISDIAEWSTLSAEDKRSAVSLMVRDCGTIGGKITASIFGVKSKDPLKDQQTLLGDQITRIKQDEKYKHLFDTKKPGKGASPEVVENYESALKAKAEWETISKEIKGAKTLKELESERIQIFLSQYPMPEASEEDTEEDGDKVKAADKEDVQRQLMVMTQREIENVLEASRTAVYLYRKDPSAFAADLVYLNPKSGVGTLSCGPLWCADQGLAYKPKDNPKIPLLVRGKHDDLLVNMFGRMVAKNHSFGVEAVAKVAHALGVFDHRPETDYFSAIDTLKSGELDAGAGMIGEADHSSGVVYQHATIHVADLLDRSPTPSQALEDLADWIDAFCEKAPRGLSAPVITVIEVADVATCSLYEGLLEQLFEQPADLKGAPQPMRARKALLAEVEQSQAYLERPGYQRFVIGVRDGDKGAAQRFRAYLTSLATRQSV